MCGLKRDPVTPTVSSLPCPAYNQSAGKEGRKPGVDYGRGLVDVKYDVIPFELEFVVVISMRTAGPATP